MLSPWRCKDYCILSGLSRCHFFYYLALIAGRESRARNLMIPITSRPIVTWDETRPWSMSCDILRKRHVVSFKMIHRCDQKDGRRYHNLTQRFVLSLVLWPRDLENITNDKAPESNYCRLKRRQRQDGDVKQDTKINKIIWKKYHFFNLLWIQMIHILFNQIFI